MGGLGLPDPPPPPPGSAAPAAAAGWRGCSSVGCGVRVPGTGARGMGVLQWGAGEEVCATTGGVLRPDPATQVPSAQVWVPAAGEHGCQLCAGAKAVGTGWAAAGEAGGGWELCRNRLWELGGLQGGAGTASSSPGVGGHLTACPVGLAKPRERAQKPEQQRSHTQPDAPGARPARMHAMPGPAGAKLGQKPSVGREGNSTASSHPVGHRHGGFLALERSEAAEPAVPELPGRRPAGKVLCTTARAVPGWERRGCQCFWALATSCKHVPGREGVAGTHRPPHASRLCRTGGIWPLSPLPRLAAKRRPASTWLCHAGMSPPASPQPRVVGGQGAGGVGAVRVRGCVCAPGHLHLHPRRARTAGWGCAVCVCAHRGVCGSYM